MLNMYGISFFNKVQLQFDVSEFVQLKDVIQKKKYTDFFIVLGKLELVEWSMAVEAELKKRLNAYKQPSSIYNPKFETRWNRLLFDTKYDLDPKDSDHFRIIMLSDILEGLTLTRKENRPFYLMPRANFANEHQHSLVLICLGILTKQEMMKKGELKKQIEAGVMEANEVNPLFDVTLDKLVEFSILTIDKDKVQLGANAGFFF